MTKCLQINDGLHHKTWNEKQLHWGYFGLRWHGMNFALGGKKLHFKVFLKHPQFFLCLLFKNIIRMNYTLQLLYCLMVCVMMSHNKYVHLQGTEKNLKIWKNIWKNPKKKRKEKSNVCHLYRNTCYILNITKVTYNGLNLSFKR